MKSNYLILFPQPNRAASMQMNGIFQLSFYNKVSLSHMKVITNRLNHKLLHQKKTLELKDIRKLYYEGIPDSPSVVENSQVINLS